MDIIFNTSVKNVDKELTFNEVLYNINNVYIRNDITGQIKKFDYHILKFITYLHHENHRTDDDSVGFHQYSISANPYKMVIVPFLNKSLCSAKHCEQLDGILQTSFESVVARKENGNYIYWPSIKISINAWFLLLHSVLHLELNLPNFFIPLPGHVQFPNPQFLLYTSIVELQEDKSHIIELPMVLRDSQTKKIYYQNYSLLYGQDQQRDVKEIQLAVLTLLDKRKLILCSSFTRLITLKPSEYLHVKLNHMIDIEEIESDYEIMNQFKAHIILKSNFLKKFNVNSSDVMSSTESEICAISNDSCYITNAFSVHEKTVQDHARYEVHRLNQKIFNEQLDSNNQLPENFNYLKLYFIGTKCNTFDYFFHYFFQVLTEQCPDTMCADTITMTDISWYFTILLNELLSYSEDDADGKTLRVELDELCKNYFKLKIKTFIDVIKEYKFLYTVLPAYIVLHFSLRNYQILYKNDDTWDFNRTRLLDFMSETEGNTSERHKQLREGYFIAISSNSITHTYKGNVYACSKTFISDEKSVFETLYEKSHQGTPLNDIVFNEARYVYATAKGNFNSIIFRNNLHGPFILTNVLMNDFLDTSADYAIPKSFIDDVFDNSKLELDYFKMFHVGSLIREKRSHNTLGRIIRVIHSYNNDSSNPNTICYKNLDRLLNEMLERNSNIGNLIHLCDPQFSIALQLFISLNHSVAQPTFKTSIELLHKINFMILQCVPIEIIILFWFFYEDDERIYIENVLQSVRFNAINIEYYKELNEDLLTSKHLLDWFRDHLLPLVFSNKASFLNHFQDVMSQFLTYNEFINSTEPAYFYKRLHNFVLEHIDQQYQPPPAKRNRLSEDTDTILSNPKIFHKDYNAIRDTCFTLFLETNVSTDKLLLHPNNDYHNWTESIYKRIIFPRYKSYHLASRSKDYSNFVIAYVYINITTNFKPENVKFLLYFFASIATFQNYEKLCVILNGKPNSGKSRLISIIKGIFTTMKVPANQFKCENKNIEGPNESRYAQHISQLCYSEETYSAFSHILKDFVDPCKVDCLRKCHGSIQKLSSGYKMVMDNNSLIKISNYDDAIYNRLMMVYFGHIFHVNTTFHNSLYENILLNNLPEVTNFSQIRIVDSLRIVLGYIHVYYKDYKEGLVLSKSVTNNDVLKHNNNVLQIYNSWFAAFEYIVKLKVSSSNRTTITDITQAISQSSGIIKSICKRSAGIVDINSLISDFQRKYKAYQIESNNLHYYTVKLESDINNYNNELPNLK
jgi:hypothetical protein